MTRVAAVDVGTNSVRLLIADPSATSGDAGPLTTLERDMRITRLGAGVDANGRLDDHALARTLDVLGAYATRWRARGAERVRVAATSAIRDAEDRQRFCAGARSRTGVEVEVLTGEQEAATAFLGATSAVSGEPPFLVLDIGGGSTEFIVGAGRPQWAASRQLGCVRLTERALPSDPPTVGELRAAAAIVDAELAGIGERVREARTLVGVAGTVTTVGALHLGLDAYEPQRIHGVRVPRAAVRELTAGLGRMRTAERAVLGPMAPGREDVIVAGALILTRVMDAFDFAEVLVSEADILDGLALQLLRGAPS